MPLILVEAFKIFNGVPIPDKNKLKSRDHYGYSSTDFIILCALISLIALGGSFDG